MSESRERTGEFRIPETGVAPESGPQAGSGSVARADKPLFTPGPLTTSRTVKEAMLRDLGSRDGQFLEVVADVRSRLLRIGGVSKERGYEAVLLQGSGTFGVESVVGSAVPPGGELLVCVNGAYGARILEIARVLGIPAVSVEFDARCPVEPAAVQEALRERPAMTHVAIVHSETTSGLVNPVGEIGGIVRAAGRSFIVDAMSSFGALPVDLEAWGVDFLVSSANKCIEGVPGFSLVLARREALLRCEGRARSLSLDLFAQWKGLDTNGQFRFTPPTHALLAFQQALDELDAEGGPPARLLRYSSVQRRIAEGMRELGFRTSLPDELQGPVITAFERPGDPAFCFDRFYRELNARGFVIYPGKLPGSGGFRIGSIGHLSPADAEGLLAAVREIMASGLAQSG